MSDVVVVGSGVVGLVTALELQQRGCHVEVWSRDEPADTVSAVAGAIWYPFLAEPRERVLGWSAVTYRRLAELALEPGSGVRMQSVVEVFATATPDLWWAAAVPAFERVPREQLPRGYAAAIRLDVPMCDTPVHLPWLRARFLAHGGRWLRRALTSLDEPFARAPKVVNCTGLGAAELCGDRELQPVRGQVLLVERPTERIDALIDGSQPRPFYVIPRGSDVVLGGSAQSGDRRLDVDATDSAAILAGIGERCPALRGASVRQVKVGLRPYRSSVRVEAELHARGRLVHNYGHGGAGYTLAWGCAAEVASLLAD